MNTKIKYEVPYEIGTILQSKKENCLIKLIGYSIDKNSIKATVTPEITNDEPKIIANTSIENLEKNLQKADQTQNERQKILILNQNLVKFP